MTLDSTDSKVQYTQSGVTTEWPVPFKFLDADDLIVITTVDGTDTTLVLDTDYTVTGAGDDAGGTVTISPALASGTRLTVYRQVDLDQPTALTVAGGWYPTVHEAVFDRLTMIAQQQQTDIDRSLKLGITDTREPGEVINDIFQASATAQGAQSAAVAAAADAEAAAEALEAFPVDLAASGGSALVGFLQDGTGATARTVQAKLRDFVSVKDFGATGDGTTDDYAAIQAAIDAATVAGGGGVFVPSGVYVVGAPVEIKSNVRLFGVGFTSIIKGVFAAPTNRILTSSASVLQENIQVEDIVIDRRGANAQHGALFGGVKNFLFRNVAIIGPENPTVTCGAVGFSSFDGFASVQSENVVVENIYLECSNNFGVAFGNVSGGKISGIRTKNCYREVIGLEAWGNGVVENIVVSDSVITVTEDATYHYGGSAGPAVLIGGATSGGTVKNILASGLLVSVSDNETDSGYQGIAIVGSAVNPAEYITLSGCTVINPTSRGLAIGASGFVTRNCVVKDVIIHNAGVGTSGGDSAVRISNATGCIIRGILATGTTHTYVVEETNSANGNKIVVDSMSVAGTSGTVTKIGATTTWSIEGLDQQMGGSSIREKATVADDAIHTFTARGTNGRAIYFIRGSFGIDDYAIFTVSSGSISTIVKGTTVAIAAANPDIDGALNVYLSGSTVVVKNRLGSSRDVVLESISTV